MQRRAQTIRQQNGREKLVDHVLSVLNLTVLSPKASDEEKEEAIELKRRLTKRKEELQELPA